MIDTAHSRAIRIAKKAGNAASIASGVVDEITVDMNACR